MIFQSNYSIYVAMNIKHIKTHYKYSSMLFILYTFDYTHNTPLEWH